MGTLIHHLNFIQLMPISLLDNGSAAYSSYELLVEARKWMNETLLAFQHARFPNAPIEDLRVAEEALMAAARTNETLAGAVSLLTLFRSELEDVEAGVRERDGSDRQHAEYVLSYCTIGFVGALRSNIHMRLVMTAREQ